MTMRIDVISLFPEWLRDLEHYGVVGRGLRQGCLDLGVWNPRDYTTHPSRRVDDRPYGGGPGMVMQTAPLARTLAAIRQQHDQRLREWRPVILLSPQGQHFKQQRAHGLAESAGCILVCGRYEGIDQRFIDRYVNEEISIGDVVLSGGELPAMMIIDAVARLMDGVLGDDRSAAEDSFSQDWLDHPHYTRPPHDQYGQVPDVLLSGHHAQVARWRLKQQLGRTWQKRPDLLHQSRLTGKQSQLLSEFIAENPDELVSTAKKQT